MLRRVFDLIFIWVLFFSAGWVPPSLKATADKCSEGFSEGFVLGFWFGLCWGLFRAVLAPKCVVIAVSTDKVNNYFLL